MNLVALTGRLTKDPEVRYSQGANSMAVARYTLAVDRKFKKEGEQSADFISCVVFGKGAEFAEKYFRKGTKIDVVGRIQTGSYEKDGKRVYTTDVVVESQEFGESKGNGNAKQSDPVPAPQADADGFFSAGDESDLPFL